MRRAMIMRLGAVGAALVGVGALVQAGAAQHARHAVQPGANGAIVFARTPDIWLVNSDGSGAHAVTTRLQPVRAYDPAWAPDGIQLAFTASGGKTGIWIVKRDGTGAKQVTTDLNDSGPTWSPDGKKIAFVRSENRAVDLYVVAAAGGAATDITAGLGRLVDDPEWSPDGSRIAFSDGSDLYLVNAGGSGLTKIARSAARRATHPSWSPDGSRIAFATLNEIWTVAPDGSGETKLTGDVGEVHEISWSPDGSQIAYIADVNGPLQEELFVMNADGSNIRRLNVDTDLTLDWGKAICTVPNVKGKPLASAQSAIAKSRCQTGTIRRSYSKTVRNGRVISQLPRPGTLQVDGGKVNLIVSKGRKR